MTTPLTTLVLLFLPMVLGLLFSRIKDSVSLNIRKYAFWGLGSCFIFFSIGHFVKTGEMVQMLPAWVPFRVLIIYLTGIMEFIIGITLLIPRIQISAAKAAMALLIIFFPANIYAAFNFVGLGGHQWGPIYLIIRGPLQIILIAWTYFLCIKSHNESSQ